LKTRNIAAEAVITSQHSRLFDFIRKRVKTEEDAEDILLVPVPKTAFYSFRTAASFDAVLALNDLHRSN
jgi:hypothetical protein